MDVLVTGSAGFVGRHLVAALEARGDFVLKLDIKDDCDCRDAFREGYSQLMAHQWDLVFHCAAEVGGRVGIDENAALLGAVNLQLDGALFEWALRTRPGRVVYFSSAAAYPTWLQNDPSGPKRLWEGHARAGSPGMPDESYGWAKLTGELMAAKVRKAGVPVTVVRPFSMYDFDQNDAEYPVPAFMERAARHETPFTVWGDGTQVRDLVHIDDAVAAILTLVEYEVNGPVNLCTGVGTSMDALAMLCMQAAGYEAPICHLLDKPVGVSRRVGDPTLLRRYYEPQIKIEDGVRRGVQARVAALS